MPHALHVDVYALALLFRFSCAGLYVFLLKCFGQGVFVICAVRLFLHGVAFCTVWSFARGCTDFDKPLQFTEAIQARRSCMWAATWDAT